jgi:hypothetical protein
MPQLQNLSLEQIFISGDLSSFITGHGDTLQSVRLHDCFSGWGEDDAIHWEQFFRNITSTAMPALRVFDISVSAVEQLEPGNKGDWRYDEAVRAKELREQYPDRRMLDYKMLDDKYGMVFEEVDKAIERFESGGDHVELMCLCKMIKKNVGDGSEV